MSSTALPQTLEPQIASWRQFLARRGALHAADLDELEDHLRSELGRLSEAGLTPEEAFLVAVRRLGPAHVVAGEFAREHSERLWKQLRLSPEAELDSREQKSFRREPWIVLGLAVVAAVLIKLPTWFGLDFDTHEDFFARNLSFFVFPSLILYFAWKRQLERLQLAWLIGTFAIAAWWVNAYPFFERSQTLTLLALHLPIALWLPVGLAYAGGRWFRTRGPIEFVRFSGELVIYYVLIALGGAVLTALTLLTFGSIGLEAEWLAQNWIVPCGAVGAVVVAAWLVELKQSVIENMAPVLTRVFTPLFTIVLLAFLATMLATRRPIEIEREILIAYDLLLAVVVGLVLFAVSSRDPVAAPSLFDRLQWVLVLAALAVDLLALSAIASRITEYGWTPNRLAALGENLILFLNLAGSAWLYLRFLRGRGGFSSLESWQTGFLPVYAGWAAIVALLFPPLFGFR